MATHVLPTAYAMNSSATNVGGWGSSALKDTMNSGEIYGKFSSDFKNAVLSVSKKYNTGNQAAQSSTPSQVNCKFWIPSYTELVNKDDSNYASWLPKLEGAQYAWCMTNVGNADTANTALQYTTRAGKTPGSMMMDYCYWMERSPYINSSSQFCLVGDEGNPTYFGATAEDRLCVAVAFCM